MEFPKGFLLGAAMAGHQVEGQNIHSNWWQAETQGLVPISGKSADHYHHYDSDFELAVSLGLNAVRISIEWSRIEPRQGYYDADAIQHYHDVLDSLHARGLTPMVTLFHWTMPVWLSDKGGFETSLGVESFSKFVGVVAKEYGQKCHLWLTINEPEVFIFEGYLWATHPPFKKNLLLTLKVYRNAIKAHKAAYRILKNSNSAAQVGVAKNVAYHEPFRPSNWLDKVLVWVAHKFGNEFFVDRIKKESDFIGLNYYFTHTLKFSWRRGFEEMNLKYPKSDMGIKTYPRGLYFLLKKFGKYRKPLYVTENGIANAHDAMRERFIIEHLGAVSQALTEGVPVMGYFIWSLIDTYEWQKGYDLKFGLAEVDYGTQGRRVRISADLFKSFIE